MSTSVARFVDESSKIVYVSLFDLYLQKINPPFFEKCGSGDKQIVRKSITKNIIPENDHIFVGKKHFVSTSKNTRAIPYVTETYAKEWIYDVDKIIKHREELNIAKQEKLKINIMETRIKRKQFDETNLKPLPYIVEIEEHERFKDADGNIFHIEMRGEKTHEGLFFKALDFDKLDITTRRVYDRITDTTSAYEYDEHYVFFEDPSTKNHLTPKKVLYITVNGLTKLFMCSRNPKKTHDVNSVNTWITILLSSRQEKEEIAARCIGISLENMRAFARTCTSSLHGVYLFAIGKVSDLSSDFVFDDTKHKPDHIVYKYGYTKNMNDRYLNHVNKYSKLVGVIALEHKLFASIDECYLSKAECFVKHYFQSSGYILSHSTEKELVVIPMKDMHLIKKLYGNVAEQYKSSVSNLSSTITDMTHQMDIQCKDHEIEILKLRMDMRSISK